MTTKQKQDQTKPVTQTPFGFFRKQKVGNERQPASNILEQQQEDELKKEMDETFTR